MSTTKTFTNIKSGKRHQIDAIARGYYDFRTTVVPQPNKPLSFDMRVYDGLNYAVDLSKNSVRPGEINFNGTVLPYLENNTLAKTNYCFGNSGINYDLPVYEEIYSNITKVGDVSINNGIASNFSPSNYLDLGNFDFSGDYEIVLKFKMPETDSDTANYKPFFDAKTNAHFYIGLSNYVNGNRYIHSDSGDGSNWYTGINGITPLELNTEYYIKISRSGTTRTMYLSTDNVTWSEEGIVDDTYTYNAEYCLGAASFLQTYDIFKGSIDLKESKITIGENIINLGDSALIPDYKISKVGSVIIKDNILSNFDSNSYATIDDTLNLGTADYEIVIGFEVTQTNTEYQVLLNSNPVVYLIIAISPQMILHSNVGAGGGWTGGLNGNTTIEINKKYLAKVKRVSGVRYMYLSSDNGNTWSEENNIADTTSCDKTFRLGQNSGGTQVFTGGKIYLEGSYIKNDNFTYNLNAIKTESKPGIFQDYEDNGKAKTLNAFSNNNEFVVLSPNENIVNYTYLGTVNIPKHKISWNDPSTPDAPTINPSALKFGDRIDNKATVVGTFDSNDGKKYVYAVLDSSYYGDKSWSTDIFNDETNTGLPDYTSAPTSQNTESATYNTDYILTNYSDKATEAFTYCRSIEPLNFNGKKYNCQLPNAYELQQIYNNRAKLYELDPTTSTNTSYNLAEWNFLIAWSSNERNTDSSWCLGKGNYWENSDFKDMQYTVIPIIEIELS